MVLSPLKIKIIVLIIVLVIWTMHSLLKVHHVEIELPVRYRNLAENLIASGTSPKTLDIFIEGKGIDIYNFKRRINYLEIEAQDFTLGSRDITITEQNLVIQDQTYRTSLVFHINQRHNFHFDRLVLKEVPVEKRYLTIDDEFFFQQENIVLYPTKVEIQGPQQVLENIRSITTIPLAADMIDTPNRTVELEIPDNVIGIKPDVVELILESPLLITRTIPLIRIEYTTDQAITIIPQYVTVKVEATADVINTIRTDMIRASIEIPANYDFAPIRFQLPQGVTLLEHTPHRVQVIRNTQ